MACITYLRRQLPFSIVRPPTHPALALRARDLHATARQSKTGFSVTFGPEIDSLLEQEKKSNKSQTKKQSTKAISRKKANTKNASLDSAEASTSTQNQGSPLPRSSIKAASNTSSADTPVEANSVEDGTTLELSGDAYETVSQARHTSANPITWSASNSSRVARSSHKRRKEIDSSDEIETSHATRSNPSFTSIPRKKAERWQVQKDALQKKFGDDGWNPRKKLSPDALEGIRNLHEQDAERYSTEILAQQFKVSPEAIRRILKSKWRASPELMEDRRQRWARRHDRIWDQQAALGLRPPRKRDREPEGPEAFEEELRAKQMLGQI